MNGLWGSWQSLAPSRWPQDGVAGRVRWRGTEGPKQPSETQEGSGLHPVAWGSPL